MNVQARYPRYFCFHIFLFASNLSSYEICVDSPRSSINCFGSISCLGKVFHPPDKKVSKAECSFGFSFSFFRGDGMVLCFLEFYLLWLSDEKIKKEGEGISTRSPRVEISPSPSTRPFYQLLPSRASPFGIMRLTVRRRHFFPYNGNARESFLRQFYRVFGDKR